MDKLINNMRNLGPARIAMMGVAIAVIVGFFSFVGMRLTQPKMGLLYGNLEQQDAAQIVSKLETQKIPYTLGLNGTQIMVPEDMVSRLRLQLAESGTPSGGSVGYELFDKSGPLGATSFMQDLNRVRALEGELSRTIRSISAVENARVHLVLPRREVFSRDVREPTASIVLRARGRIDQAQVRAIQNLVAAAVPDLKPSRVSIVDDRGNLLASGNEERDPKTGAVAALTDARTQIEMRMKQSVESLLERSLGTGQIRAEVSVDLDLDRETTNSESYDPDGQVVRSTQTISEQNQSAEGQQNVTVANNLPEAAGNQNANQATTRGQRTEELVNYEITKTTRTKVRDSGIVRRLTVAVLVNGQSTTNAEGQKTYQPRSEEELKQISALVRSAVGFDEKRGDTVEVVSLRFNEIEIPDVDNKEPELFLGLTKPDLFRIGELLALVIISLLVLIFVARPIIGRMLMGGEDGDEEGGAIPIGTLGGLPAALPGPEGLPSAGELPSGGGSGIESMIDIARIEGQVKASSLKKIGEIVDKHPEEAVAIIRNWLYQAA